MAMRDNDYTLIGWLPKKPDSVDMKTWMATSDPQTFELYDMIRDPLQQHDIAKQKPGIVAAMRKDMISLWREMRDEGLAGKHK